MCFPLWHKVTQNRILSPDKRVQLLTHTTDTKMLSYERIVYNNGQGIIFGISTGIFELYKQYKKALIWLNRHEEYEKFLQVKKGRLKNTDLVHLWSLPSIKRRGWGCSWVVMGRWLKRVGIGVVNGWLGG